MIRLVPAIKRTIATNDPSRPSNETNHCPDQSTGSSYEPPGPRVQSTRPSYQQPRPVDESFAFMDEQLHLHKGPKGAQKPTKAPEAQSTGSPDGRCPLPSHSPEQTEQCVNLGRQNCGSLDGKFARKT